MSQVIWNRAVIPTLTAAAMLRQGQPPWACSTALSGCSAEKTWPHCQLSDMWAAGLGKVVHALGALPGPVQISTALSMVISQDSDTSRCRHSSRQSPMSAEERLPLKHNRGAPLQCWCQGCKCALAMQVLTLLDHTHGTLAARAPCFSAPRTADYLKGSADRSEA